MQSSTKYATLLSLVSNAPLFATIFGRVRGVAHDPDHRPVPDAHVSLRSASSEYK